MHTTFSCLRACTTCRKLEKYVGVPGGTGQLPVNAMPAGAGYKEAFLIYTLLILYPLHDASCYVHIHREVTNMCWLRGNVYKRTQMWTSHRELLIC